MENNPKQTQTTIRNKEIIKRFFANIFGTGEFDEKVISQNVAPEYIQHVDGKTLEYDEFVRHIRHLKEKSNLINVEFLTLVEEGDTVFSNHIVNFTLKDGAKGKSHVIAEFRLKDGKLYYCDELTFMIEGREKDRNLGAATN